MANMHLVTGRADSNHVNSADDGSMYAAIWGTGSYVLNRGSKLTCTVVTNNQVTIADGDLVMQGRHARINYGNTVSLTIENGASGYNRNDLIVARYTNVSDVEAVNLVVIKGTATTGTASDPSYTSGNILQGASTADFPLYRIPLTGLTVGTPAAMFTTVSAAFSNVLKSSDIYSWAKASKKPTYTASEVGAAATSHTHAATDIASGTLASDRLPTVPVSKGGTGATSASAALTNLGAAASNHNHDGTYLKLTGGNLTGALAVGNKTSYGDENVGVWISKTGAVCVRRSISGGHYYMYNNDDTYYTELVPASLSNASTNVSITFPATSSTLATTADLANKADASHNHAASNITSGTLSSDRLPTVPVAKGGTGATTAAAALTNLGAAAASHNHSASNITSGTLAVGRGGTGLTASPSAQVNLASTSAASLFVAKPSIGVTGILPVANGGTGASSGNGAIKAMLAAGATILSSNQYGSSLPSSGTTGQIFFKLS